jgi:hypothetical protein
MRKVSALKFCSWRFDLMISRFFKIFHFWRTEIACSVNGLSTLHNRRSIPFRLVAQCLNQLRYRVPHLVTGKVSNVVPVLN